MLATQSYEAARLHCAKCLLNLYPWDETARVAPAAGRSHPRRAVSTGGSYRYRMGILELFARRRSRDAAATRLYIDAVQQARLPVFYTEIGVPDTMEARFALVSLHVHLLCRRLSRESRETGGALAQALFDMMFADMDRNLREMGVGDLAVGKKIKKLAGGHYAAAQRVEWALEDGGAAIGEIVSRTLGDDISLSDAQTARLTDYVNAAVEDLSAQDSAALLDGRAAFPALSS